MPHVAPLDLVVLFLAADRFIRFLYIRMTQTNDSKKGQNSCKSHKEETRIFEHCCVVLVIIFWQNCKCNYRIEYHRCNITVNSTNKTHHWPLMWIVCKDGRSDCCSCRTQSIAQRVQHIGNRKHDNSGNTAKFTYTPVVQAKHGKRFNDKSCGNTDPYLSMRARHLLYQCCRQCICNSIKDLSDG